MRFARVAVGSRVRWGRVDRACDGDMFVPLHGDIFGGATRADDGMCRVDDVRLLVPVQPSKIVAVGRNYADHAAELAAGVPERPRIFLKPPSSLIGPSEAIRLPLSSHEVHHEAELAVVIGRVCRNVPAEKAGDVIAGLTCANDVTARDIQRADGLPTYAKSFDTFCPVGPWIETELSPDDLHLTCAVNGEPRQDDRTSSMIWSVSDLIAYVSAAMTLLPGDVLLTGTPAGVRAIRPGDEVSVTIEGIGTLTNPVIADDSPHG